MGATVSYFSCFDDLDGFEEFGQLFSRMSLSRDLSDILLN